MADLAPFADPEAAVADLLGAVSGVKVTYAGVRTLATIRAGQLPAVRVSRTGGADDLVQDTALLSVDVFAADIATAKSVAEACRQRLVSGPFGAGSSFSTAAGNVDGARTAVAPQAVTSPDVAVPQCVTAGYRVWMRR